MAAQFDGDEKKGLGLPQGFGNAGVLGDQVLAGSVSPSSRMVVASLAAIPTHEVEHLRAWGPRFGDDFALLRRQPPR